MFLLIKILASIENPLQIMYTIQTCEWNIKLIAVEEEDSSSL